MAVSFSDAMPCMYEALISSPKFEDIGCHQQECIWQGLQRHRQTAGAEALRYSHQQSYDEQCEKRPPLHPPYPVVARAKHGKKERKAQQKQTRYGKLLEQLIAKVPIAGGKRLT